MENSTKYSIIESMILSSKFPHDRPSVEQIYLIKKEVIKQSKGRENPDLLDLEIQDTFDRMFG